MYSISKQSTITLFIGLVVGLSIGLLFSIRNTAPNEDPTQIRGGGKLFTNPLLECEVARGSIDAQKLNFSSALNAQITALTKEHKLNSVGVYFRDLNNGPTFGQNQDDGYFPASLLKLPVALTLYKMNEGDAALLDEKIHFASAFPTPQAGNKQYITPSNEIRVGERYTIRELIRRSLVFSDNQAVALLYEKINATNPQALRDVYRLLGVNEELLNGPDATISVKQYSAFLRILYNSSYLKVEDSEKILEMLSQTEFNNGLVAGVPADIVIAHKFGESGFENGERQLHDCGIVYYPKHPYLLCIMSRGDTLESLAKSIADISHFVFEQIDSQYTSQE